MTAGPRTVAEAVGATLAALGVRHAYGVVGSGNFAMTNALRDAGVRFTAARHEGGAATMADAHARTSGEVTVVTVHQGPGLTNALTGIAEAAKSRTPMVVLAADVGRGSVRSNFRVDQDGLAVAVGAVAERVHTAESAVADVVRAFRVARQQRRTVVLGVPLDVGELDCPTPVPDVAIEGWGPTRPDTASVASLVALLDSAQRPVFVAGRGAREAGPELVALAARCGALLTTSAVAHGLFAGAPWSLGICGGFATDVAATLVAEADLVVAFGASLTMWTTRHGALIGEDATVVQVDDDPAALGAHRPIDLGVLGDVGEVARDLGVAVGGVSPGYRTPEVGKRLAVEGRWGLPADDLSGADGSGGDRIDPAVLSARLDDLLPAERTVAVDSGNFMGHPAAYLGVPDQAGFCFTQGFQSVGLGLATAIGAAVARPERLTVAALGDGGFCMGVADLETAARLALGLLVVIYDDAGYGAEVHHFTGADHTTVTFPDRDLAEIGRGFGCEGLVVRSAADLSGITTWLDGPRDRPLVVDAKVVDAPSWWLAEAFRGH